jgi:hypothetical protein
MKSILSTMIALTLTTSAFASTNDVFPQIIHKGDHYVRVTRLTGNPVRVRLEDCQWKLEDQTCEAIGPMESYKESALRKARFWQRANIAASGLGDAAVLIASFYGGVFVGGWAAGSLGLTSGMTGMSAAGEQLMFGTGIATAIGSTGYLAATKNALNPYRQYKIADTINDDVINDRNVEVSNMQEYMEYLNIILRDVKE